MGETGEQSHLFVLFSGLVVEVGDWGQALLGSPGWPMILPPVSTSNKLCVPGEVTLFSEPVSPLLGIWLMCVT